MSDHPPWLKNSKNVTTFQMGHMVLTFSDIKGQGQYSDCTGIKK